MPGRQELDATEVDHTGVSFPSYRSQCGDDPDPEEQETSVSKKGETREGTEYKEMDNDPDETLVPADTLSGGRVSNEASSNNETDTDFPGSKPSVSISRTPTPVVDPSQGERDPKPEGS